VLGLCGVAFDVEARGAVKRLAQSGQKAPSLGEHQAGQRGPAPRAGPLVHRSLRPVRLRYAVTRPGSGAVAIGCRRYRRIARTPSTAIRSAATKRRAAIATVRKLPTTAISWPALPSCLVKIVTQRL